MSNYADSVLAKGQAVVTKRNQQPEQRRKMPTVFELAIKNQEYSIPNAQELRVSPLRTVEINYFTNVAAGSSTAKAYNHTGIYGDSGKVELVYVSTVETFSLPRKLYYNSVLSYENAFNNLYEMKWKNLRTRHDTAALAFLYANRVQLAAATIEPQIASAGFNGTVGQWDDTNKALTVNAGYNKQFIQYAKQVMASRYFTGELDIIADLQMAAQFDYAAQQGQGNAANTAFQFAGCNIASTQDVIDSEFTLGSILAMPKGMFAGLNWNEGLNKKGVNQDIGGPIGTLGTIQDPFGSGAIADISMYTQRADTSANTTGGSTQDIVDQWELTLTIGYALPPLSTSLDSVVHEIAQGN